MRLFDRLKNGLFGGDSTGRITSRSVIMTFILLLIVSLSGFSFKIGMLEIRGNYTISNEEIMSVIDNCREGNDVNYSQIEKDIFNIRDMGYFQDVKYELSNYVENTKVLTIDVVEYPVVSEVTLKVEGPGLLSKKELEEFIVVETGKALDFKKLIRSKNAIKNQYITSGYQLLEIKDNIDRTDNGVFIPGGKLEIVVWEYGLYDLVLKGDLGDITYEEVKEILDLRFFKDYYEDFWKFFLIRKNYYPSKSELQMALSRLFNTGLIGQNTKVDFDNLPEPLENGEHVTNLVIDVELNPVVPDGETLTAVSIQGNNLLASSEIIKELRSTGDMNTVLIDVLRDVQKIKQLYEDAGYPMIVVNPVYNSDEDSLTFRITEGILKDYRIQGLTKTREDLVRREITLEKGKPIEMKELKQTYANLNKTGYFSSINLEPVGLSKNSNEVTLIVKLKELENNVEFRTNVTFDPRYGGDNIIQNIYGEIGLGLINPLGQGQRIDVSSTLGKFPSISLGYNVTSVFSSPIDAGINVTYGKQAGRTTMEYTPPSTDTQASTVVNYQSDNFTIKPSLSYRIDDLQKISTDFTWGMYKRYNYETDDATVTQLINNQLTEDDKKGLISIFGLGYQFDTRDDLLDPNYGILFKARGEYSVPWASEHWFRLEESITGFYSPWENHIFGGRLISTQIPYEDGDPIDYTIGGSGNKFIRGINRDFAISQNYVAGLNLEYRWRFVDNNTLSVAFAAFNDNALGWDDFSKIGESKLFSSVGLGVRFNVPGFGVLRLDIPFDVSPSLWGDGAPIWGGISFGYGQMF